MLFSFILDIKSLSNCKLLFFWAHLRFARKKHQKVALLVNNFIAIHKL
jgi:hypothetical protein